MCRLCLLFICTWTNDTSTDTSPVNFGSFHFHLERFKSFANKPPSGFVVGLLICSFALIHLTHPTAWIVCSQPPSSLVATKGGSSVWVYAWLGVRQTECPTDANLACCRNLLSTKGFHLKIELHSKPETSKYLVRMCLGPKIHRGGGASATTPGEGIKKFKKLQTRNFHEISWDFKVPKMTNSTQLDPNCVVDTSLLGNLWWYLW